MKKILTSIFIILAIFSVGMNIHTFADGPLEPLVINGDTVYHYSPGVGPVLTPENYVEKTSEFRGVWTATVYNINIAQHTSETQYKAAYDAILDNIEANHMNAILFQVRPRNDAFYQSAYAPFSRYLAGSEGADPGWDVMEYLVSEAHSRGIEFHAWMNPYRVTTSASETLSSLHPTNFARLNPNLAVQDNDGKYILNPGEPEVVNYIKNVVSEIMDLYDIDGIHFDDYFYPYAGLTSDTETYNTYKLPGETLGDFRRRSVNNAISGVKSEIDAHNLAEGTDVRFGVSPIGLWKVGAPDGADVAPGSAQSYYGQYADTKKWIDEGWIHYVNPQIYWNFEHSMAPYADVVDWWAEAVRGTGVDLIIGHGIYRYNEYPLMEFYEQIRYNQKHPEIKGSMLYSSSYLNTTSMAQVRNNQWTTTPLNVWESSNVDSPTHSLSGTLDGSIYTSNVTVTLNSTHDLFYHMGDGIWQSYTEPFVISEEGEHTVYYKAVNVSNEESLIQAFDLDIQKINNDIPTVSITGDMVGTNYVEGSVVTISASEQPIWYVINLGEWQLYTEPITLSTAGKYRIQTKTINSENVESELVSRIFDIVVQSYPDPTISIDGIGNDPFYQSAEITINGDAPIISYKIDDGNWQTYTTPFTLDQEGDYVITVRNEDGLQKEIVKQITIDQTPPTDPIITITGEKEGLYYLEETSVDLSAENGTDEIFYRLHNGNSWSDWALYEDTIWLVLNATYTLDYYARDGALNETELLSERIRLSIPPSENNRFVIRDGDYVNYYQTNTPIELPTEYVEKEAEVRAVWVATVSNIDIGMHYSETSYKNEIISILDRLEALNFNVMFFQTRPMNDAFYDSEYAPWSRYIMGAEGIDPGWDIFQFILDEAHHRGIEVHAWLNPYRVSTGTADKQTQLNLLHDENFAKQNPELVIQDKQGKLILNPGEPRVRAYITNVISELMSKYDVDGIHFDDYFYSYGGTDDIQDDATYNRSKLTNETKDDWRRRNVDMLIESLSSVITNWNTNHDANVKFGISPFGIWQSGGEFGSNTSTGTMQSYYAQYADTRKWVLEGWLDYIMPQLYWEFDHGSAPFADLVDWWAELTEQAGVDLIIGQGFYRYAENTWTDPNEMTEQLRYISQYDSIIGSSWFSYKTLNSPNSNVVQSLERIQEYYWTEYPSFPWESDVVKTIDPLVNPTFDITGKLVSTDIYESSVTISFTSDYDVYYKINDGAWTLYANDLVINEFGNYVISYKAVGTDLNESAVESITLNIVNPVDEPALDFSGTLVSGNRYEDSVTLSLSSDDDIYYKINDGQWTLYNNDLVFDEIGTYTLTFKAIGINQNESPISTTTFEVVNLTCQEGYESVNGECVVIEEPEPETGCWSTLNGTSAIFVTFSLVLGVAGIFFIRRKK